MRLLCVLFALAAALATDLAIAQTVTISGTVRNTQSAGVAGAVVSVLRVDDFLGGGVVTTTTTDAQGAYVVVINGNCGLQCRVSVTAAGRVVSPDIRIVGPTTTDQDFVAALPSTINVRVETFDTGTPVPGLRPYIVHRNTAQAPLLEDLGAGTWRFDAVFPGPLRVCAQDDNDAFVGTCQFDQVMPFTNVVSGLSDTQPAEGAALDVVLRLRRGATLTGILTDAYRSTPIVSTNVGMTLFDFPGTTTRGLGLRTDAEGRYRVPGLPPGAYRLQVTLRSPYYTTMRYPGIECLLPEDCQPNSGSYVTLNGAAVADNLGFELFPGAVLTGRITDQATGAPLSGIEVRAYQTQIFVGTIRVASATTGADGRYAVTNIPLEWVTKLGTANSAGFVDIGWPGAVCDTIECTGGSTFTVQSGVSTAAYDFTLAAGRAISGAIEMSGVSPGALEGTLTVFRDNGAQLAAVGQLPISPGQTYVTRGFPAGTYFAQARLGGACLVHAQQACTGNLPPNPATATAIVLPLATGTFPGVDFVFPPDPLYGNGFE